MKILFITTHLNTGGITKYIATLSKGLIDNGHKIFIASSGGGREEEFLSMGCSLVKLDIKTKSELDYRIYFAAIKLKKFILEKNIDIVHSQTRITQVMGKILSMICHKPYLSTCHGFFKKRLSRAIAPCWGDAVIAISSAVKDHLTEDFHVPEEKIFLVNNGIDLSEFPLGDKRTKLVLRSKFHLSGEPVVGIIARLSDVKGQDILIKAMSDVVKEIPNAKLLIVGEGKKEFVLRKLAEELSLSEHVVFYPTVNKTNEVLSMLDVFVMPSRQEGLGLSIMEAQASGLCVVASAVGGIPSLIKDGKTGILVESENVNLLAKGIVKALTDKEFSQRMGEESRKFIRENYSHELMTDKTINVYKRLTE